MKFHELIVSDLYRDTEDSLIISFAVPPHLSMEYVFMAGQYLTLETEIGGEAVRRTYSLCNHPHDGLRVAVKKIENGVFSGWAMNHLRKGMKLGVATPQGNFIHRPDPDRSAVYVAFVAGSGITPVMSIIHSVLRGEPNSRFILFYGNRTKKDIIFRDELEDIKNRYLNRFQILHILSGEKQGSDILSGRIDPIKCRDYFRYFIPTDSPENVFLCGPFEMIKGMKEALLEMNIEPKRILNELFFNPEAEHADMQVKTKAKTIKSRTLKITVDGLTTELQTDVDLTVLDLAIQAGMDMPFSCKGGVCATCKARVEEGEVEMTTNFALEEEEVEAGFVLTCQSHVRSDYIHVNYDAV